MQPDVQAIILKRLARETMLITQSLRGFDDVRDGFFAGEQGEDEAIGGFGRRDRAEKIGSLGHWVLSSIESINSLSKSD